MYLVTNHYARIPASVIRDIVSFMFFQPASPSSVRNLRSARSQWGWAVAISRLPASVRLNRRSRRSFPRRAWTQPCFRSSPNVRVRVVLSMAKPALSRF
jgi:hypothetical protein